MSLSIDPPAVLPAAPVSADRPTSAGVSGGQGETDARQAGGSPAYTIAATASGAVPASDIVLSGVKHDLDADGARLMALQVQQSLSGQTVSIANQSSQAVLSLFRA